MLPKPSMGEYEQMTNVNSVSSDNMAEQESDGTYQTSGSTRWNRKHTLAWVLLILVVAAVAIGLGVGLSSRHNDQSEDVELVVAPTPITAPPSFVTPTNLSPEATPPTSKSPTALPLPSPLSTSPSNQPSVGISKFSQCQIDAGCLDSDEATGIPVDVNVLDRIHKSCWV